MDSAKKIRASFKKLQGKIKSGKEISEEDLRVAFVKSGILEVLGYEGELKDIRFEKGIRGKRSDLLAFDDYQNVIFVVEFKRPTEIDVERDFAQLWERYVKPLRARYGVLTDGLELLIYERINSNWEQKLHVNLGVVALSQCEELSEWLKKPEIKRTRIEEVLRYFERFDKHEERVNLSSEIAQQHFFDSFELKGDSIFVNLLQKTIGLFDFELERSKFLKSAYNFWRISYAKKPEKVPENWRRIMDKIGLETNEENLFKFMFCLESAYSLFTRLILAKACEDYKLPYIEFSKFIKTEIERTSYRGDITLLAWAVTTKNLIESMKQKLVKSVFEGDIFYWWEDSYRELKTGAALYSPRYEKQKGRFGDALAEIILTLYKFDFSEIVGDPLGTLYQRYFDKETRKALGEFYTPIEVVKYILDAVGYEGRSVIDKRLLDPACGSGTFLVEALRRYLKASEEIAEDWSGILKKLCNEYCIAGFDIHPFATFMAQMQFMLVLIPKYKKAMEEDPKFVLNRLPIFRTDSLVDETKGEARKVTIETFESGIRYILIDTGLPVDGGNLRIKMPYDKDVFAGTDLLNVQEYFAALQAVFDTVKESAWQEKYEVEKGNLERNFKRYLEDKKGEGLVSFFTPYAEHFLQKFEELKNTFGDGKLIKSIEDIMLAAILKNYVKYDFVVGNPPYVKVQLVSKGDRESFEKNFKSTATGARDPYMFFVEKGLSWLLNNAKLGMIISDQFILSEQGKAFRDILGQESKIIQLIDFRDVVVFGGLTNYVSILALQNKKGDGNILRTVRVFDKRENLLGEIKKCVSAAGDYTSNNVFDCFSFPQNIIRLEEEDVWGLMPVFEKSVFDKIKEDKKKFEEFLKYPIFKGFSTSKDTVYFVEIVHNINENLVEIRPIKSDRTYIIEKGILKPLLKGKTIINKWKIVWNGLYSIFPYLIVDGRPILISTEKMKQDYPKTWEYFLNFERELRDRERGHWKKRDDWYGFSRPQNLEKVWNKKILVPLLCERNRFAMDEDGKFCDEANIYNIVLGEDYAKRYGYNSFLGVLNSTVVEFYLKHISNVKTGKHFEYRTQYISKIPIKHPKTTEEKQIADKIIKNVNLILQKTKLEQKNEKFPDEYIQEYRSKGEEFDTKSISFNSNHKALEPLVEEIVDSRGYNITIGKKEQSVYAESRLKADYVVTALKGKNAKKDEKKLILIPKSDAIVEEILKKLEEDKAMIKSPTLAELEEEINVLVYKLYGLNEEDVKVIEDFLRRV
jgi:hypothetical protein